MEEILTAEQLERDCLCYMSITGKPVKSSRFWLGHFHEEAVGLVSEHFGKPADYFKKVKPKKKILDNLQARLGKDRVFFNPDSFHLVLNDPVDMYEFTDFEEAYHQLMRELCDLTVESVKLILPEDDETANIYITGGFSQNSLFLQLINEAFPLKKVWISEIGNSSALGAALVISASSSGLNLGLTECS